MVSPRAFNRAPSFSANGNRSCMVVLLFGRLYFTAIAAQPLPLQRPLHCYRVRAVGADKVEVAADRVMIACLDVQVAGRALIAGANHMRVHRMRRRIQRGLLAVWLL